MENIAYCLIVKGNKVSTTVKIRQKGFGSAALL
jgi:hypothetical protein